MIHIQVEVTNQTLQGNHSRTLNTPAEYPTWECKPDTKELHGKGFDQLFWKIRGQKHPYGVKLHAHKHLSLFILHVSII